MNKIRYRYFHTYTEAKSAFILADEKKTSKMDRSSYTKNSKENSTGAANSRNNKYKESNNNRKD